MAVAEMARRIEGVLAAHEWLVLERAGELLGYAYAGRFRERAAYRHATESTIYLRHGLEGKGLGAPLYGELVKRTFARGYRHLVGAIALPNEPSVRLHERLGPPVDLKALFRGVSARAHGDGAERHQQAKLQAVALGRLWQIADKPECLREVLRGFSERPAAHRTVAGVEPVLDGRLPEFRLAAVYRHDLRLTGGDCWVELPPADFDSADVAEIWICLRGACGDHCSLYWRGAG